VRTLSSLIVTLTFLIAEEEPSATSPATPSATVAEVTDPAPTAEAPAVEAPAPDSPPALPMNPSVKIETSLGDIIVELNAEKAPLTVKNFLSYVEDKFYDGTIFHRVISNFMIQGGGMTPDMEEKDTKAPITNESSNGLKNELGTIAMARTNDLNSATSQFFINTVDNRSLNHGGPYGGYCVFGKVTDGIAIVKKIEAVPTRNKGYHGDVPVQEVTILSITKIEE